MHGEAVGDPMLTNVSEFLETTLEKLLLQWNKEDGRKVRVLPDVLEIYNIKFCVLL